VFSNTAVRTTHRYKTVAVNSAALVIRLSLVVAATVMLWTAGDVVVQTATCRCRLALRGINTRSSYDAERHAQFSARRNANTFIAIANKLSDLQYRTVPSIRPIRLMVVWRQTFTQT
jgi:hypothetical protein